LKYCPDFAACFAGAANGTSLLGRGSPDVTSLEPSMRALNIITLLLIIVGGLNWLLVGLFQFDLVAAIFGGQDAALARVVYVLVGLSALWQLGPLVRSFDSTEGRAQRNV
jgi:uncharacterized membrane protein YuzA (DUF378 family)